MSYLDTPCYIYALIDPKTNALRYVGCTQNVKVRLTNHISRATCYPSSPKDFWLKHLLETNNLIKTEILAITTRKHADVVERDHIRYYSARCDLFNQRTLLGG